MLPSFIWLHLSSVGDLQLTSYLMLHRLFLTLQPALKCFPCIPKSLTSCLLPSVGSVSSLPRVTQNFMGVLGHKDWGGIKLLPSSTKGGSQGLLQDVKGCLLICSQKPPVINMNTIMLKNFLQYFCAFTVRTAWILLASSSRLLALYITKKRLFSLFFKKSLDLRLTFPSVCSFLG